MKYAGFIFYPKDWLSDKRLSLCSLATKGAWMDLICYMYESERCGYLVVNGKTLAKADIRRMIKCGDQEFESIWNELIDNGVMKQHADGTFYSKRMVQEMSKMAQKNTISKDEIDLVNSISTELKAVTNNSELFEGEKARSLILAQLRNGAKPNEFIQVVKYKTEEWGNSDRWSKYLRPATLFSEENFKKYLNEAMAKPAVVKEKVSGNKRMDYDDL